MLDLWTFSECWLFLGTSSWWSTHCSVANGPWLWAHIGPPVQWYLCCLHSCKHISDVAPFMVLQLPTNSAKTLFGPESTTLTHWEASLALTRPAMLSIYLTQTPSLLEACSSYFSGRVFEDSEQKQVSSRVEIQYNIQPFLANHSVYWLA